MNAQELAARLNGREYGNETTPKIEAAAKSAGLVIVFAYEDDTCEFRGAIYEEIECYGGECIFFNKYGSNFTYESGKAPSPYYQDKDEPEANMIEAVWCGVERIQHSHGGYYTWTFKTDIPHETFDIIADNKPFCRGIVFSIADLK